MSESDVIARAEGRPPVTVASLATDLAALGLERGMTVLVHTALSRLGWIVGGAQAYLEALRAALGPEGTLMMPTQSTHLTEPSHWQSPPVPEAWLDAIRAEMPAFDVVATPTRRMGAAAELFRQLPGVRRSDHPHCSFAAAGPLAEQLLASQPLDDPFGEASPLEALRRCGGYVLLAGVDHRNNTSLHLAERRGLGPRLGREQQGAPLWVDGQRRWVAFEAPAHDDEDFAALGEDFARHTDAEHRGPLGWGEGRFFAQAAVVAYGEGWLSGKRPG